MRARTAALAALIAGTSAASGAKLAPADIQTTFFDGQAFTAATPSGVRFKMTFTPDGKMMRQPLDRSGARGEGTWTLAPDGFCTTWKGGRQHCFTILPSGGKTWSVMKSSTPVAVWSK
jgi:hypothetical protein